MDEKLIARFEKEQKRKVKKHVNHNINSLGFCEVYYDDSYVRWLEMQVRSIK